MGKNLFHILLATSFFWPLINHAFSQVSCRGSHDEVLESSIKVKSALEMTLTQVILDRIQVFQGLNSQEPLLKSDLFQECKAKYAENFPVIQSYESLTTPHPDDDEKMESSLIFNFINALKAEALFRINKDYYAQALKIRNESNFQKNQCRIQENQCRQETPFYKDTKACEQARKNCVASIEEKKKENLENHKKTMWPLFTMVSSSPLLFQSSLDGNLLAPFQEDKLERSELQKVIIAQVKLQYLQQLEETLRAENPLGVALFFSQNNRELLDLINRNKKEWIKVQKKMLSREMNRLSKSVSVLCSDIDLRLHHYPRLVELSYKQYLADSLTKKEWSQGVCYLDHLSPKKDLAVNRSLILASGLLASGIVLQFVPIFPGVANVAGVAFISSSGAVFAGIGIKESLEVHHTYQIEMGLHSAGLQGYEELLKTKDIRNNNFAWSTLDLALLPLDILAMAIIKTGKKLPSLMR